MRGRLFFFLGLGFAVCAACGGAEDSSLLDSGGGGNDAGGGNDVIVGNDTAPPIDSGPNCAPTCATIPQGFRPVRIGDANTACPSGWDTANGFTNPVGTDNACTCSCNVTTQPDCTTGKIFRGFDDTSSATCGNTANTLPVNGSTCEQIGGTLYFSHYHYVADPPPPSGGACQFDAQLDQGKLSGTPARLCAPPQSCLAEICDGGAVCVATDGDQACPTDFPTKTLMGDAVTGTCGSCGSCSATGTCSGTLAFFTDQNCTTGETDVAADAVCKTNAISGTTGFVAYNWKGALAKSSCAGTPSSTVQPALDKPVTVCCK